MFKFYLFGLLQAKSCILKTTVCGNLVDSFLASSTIFFLRILVLLFDIIRSASYSFIVASSFYQHRMNFAQCFKKILLSLRTFLFFFEGVLGFLSLFLWCLLPFFNFKKKNFFFGFQISTNKKHTHCLFNEFP